MEDANKYRGEDYLVLVNTNNTGTGEANWKVAHCQTTCTVNEPKDTVDGSSKCGNSTSVVDGTPTIEFEGQTLKKLPPGDTSAHISLKDWMDLADSNEEYDFKVAPKGETADDDGKIIFSGKGVITNNSHTFGNKEFATSSATITINGKLTKTEFVYTT